MDNLPTAPKIERQFSQVEAFMPLFDIATATERRNAIVAFTKTLMVEGTDYGTIPGIDKPTLLKPGAEKLTTLFGLVPEYVYEAVIEDWTGANYKEPLFFYRIKCKLTRNGFPIGEGIGSANSWEAKHRYRWVKEAQIPTNLNKANLPTRDSSLTEFQFAIQKAETSGQYGKPLEYWNRFIKAMADSTAIYGSKKTRGDKELPCVTIPDVAYRVPNTDIADVVNALVKMAAKRSHVAAILVAVNASEFYTQDVEDMDIIDVPFTVVPKGNAPDTSNVSDAVPAADKKPTAKKGTAKETTGTAAPPNLANAEADALAALDESQTIAGLTDIFNKLPADIRRPGTKVFEKFKAAREKLMPSTHQSGVGLRAGDDDIPF